MPVKVHLGFNAFDNSNAHCGCKTVPAMRARERGCEREIFFAAAARVPQIAIAPLALSPFSPTLMAIDFHRTSANFYRPPNCH